MLATIVANRVHVKLSRRNLRHLQAILDNPDGHHNSLRRTGENGVIVVVEVEDDAAHYGRRDSAPGVAPGA